MAAFISAAMVLPGMSAQAQDQRVRSDDFSVSYNHVNYTESDSRMDIKADQLSLTAPISDRFELKLNTIKDVMSGASPEYYIQGADGKPVQVLQSGASIKDTRDALDITLGYYGDAEYVAVSVGQSEEDDYDAKFSSVQYRRDFNDKTTSLLLSAARSSDDVWRADVPGTNINHRNKTDLQAGVSQILDRNSTIQLSLTQSRSSGSLSDPYKRAYIGDLGGALPESRPGKRSQTILASRYSRYLESTDSALHVDFRYAFDEWDANSITLEAKWKKKLTDTWTVTPSLRYYSQSNANFYDLYFNSLPADGYYSTDYRLAGFGAISTKLAVTKAFTDKISVNLMFEHYDRQYVYVLDSGSKGHNADDYNMNLISLSFNVFF